MMKFLVPLLTLLFSNFKGFAKDPAEMMMQKLTLHMRALAKVIVAAIGSVVLGCVGVSLLISSVATQLDKPESFQFMPSMAIYVGMTLLAVIVLIYSLRQKTWLKAVKAEEKPKAETTKSGALENALALLVLDFVEERQNRRKSPEASAQAEK